MLPVRRFAERFECSVGVIRCFSKPDNDTIGAGIYLGYELNLLFFLFVVFLVDADGIYPQDAVEEAISEM